MQGAQDQCSNGRRVSNKRRVFIKGRGFEVRVLINAPAFIRSFTVYSYEELINISSSFICPK